MKNLLLVVLVGLMPFLLYSDPCPEDTTPPVIVSNGSIWDCTFNIFEDSDTNFITVTEESECGLRIVEIADWDLVKGNCEDDFVKRYTVTWYAEDVAGNVTNFTQEITIARPSPVDIVFPVDTMVQCPASGYDDADLFGYPSINGIYLTDMCGFRVKYNILDTLPTLVEGQCLTEVRKEWTIIENCSGLILKDTQDIALIDTIRPIIACTALDDTVTLVIAPDQCDTLYTFPETDAIDFCAPDSQLVFKYLIDGEPVGSEVLLEAGLYEGSVIVTDPCNNSDTCNYTIAILDVSPPVVECTEPDTILLTEDNQIVDINDLGFSVSECTGDVDLVYRFSDQTPGGDATEQTFTCDMVNTTVSVIVTATDTSGNQSDPLACEIYVSAEAGVCPAMQVVGNPSPKQEKTQIADRSKAYYNGRQLIVESEAEVNALTLYNISGRIIWQKEWTNSRSNFQTHLPDKVQNGVYILKIQKKNGQTESIKLAIF